MKYVPSLEKSFRPMIVELRKFKENATVPFAICVERQNGYRYRYDMNVYPGDNENNYEMIERVIKSILWVVGGYKIYLGGNEYIVNKMQEVFSLNGTRAFDVDFMSRVYDKPFEVDDFIKIDNEAGQVEEIKIRTTRLRMTDGSQKIYPNTTVANSAIINLSRMSHRLINENLGIEYKHSSKEINAFCSKLKELILSYDESDKSDVRVNFTDYSDSSLDIEVFFYVDIPSLQDYLTFKSKFNCDVKTLADDMNIDFAFTSRSVYFANELEVKNNAK